MAIKCEICEREFKTTQGRRGHMTFVHQMTNTSVPVAKPVTEQQTRELEGRIEQLTSKLELLDERLTNLSSKVEKQAEQQKRFGEYIITNGAYCWVKDPRINKCKYGLEQLPERYEKLSRFIQYEFAGIQDDIIWEIALVRPEFERRSHKLK